MAINYNNPQFQQSFPNTITITLNPRHSNRSFGFVNRYSYSGGYWYYDVCINYFASEGFWVYLEFESSYDSFNNIVINFYNSPQIVNGVSTTITISMGASTYAPSLCEILCYEKMFLHFFDGDNRSVILTNSDFSSEDTRTIYGKTSSKVEFFKKVIDPILPISSHFFIYINDWMFYDVNSLSNNFVRPEFPLVKYKLNNKNYFIENNNPNIPSGATDIAYLKATGSHFLIETNNNTVNFLQKRIFSKMNQEINLWQTRTQDFAEQQNFKLNQSNSRILEKPALYGAKTGTNYYWTENTYYNIDDNIGKPTINAPAILRDEIKNFNYEATSSDEINRYAFWVNRHLFFCIDTIYYIPMNWKVGTYHRYLYEFNLIDGAENWKTKDSSWKRGILSWAGFNTIQWDADDAKDSTVDSVPQGSAASLRPIQDDIVVWGKNKTNPYFTFFEQFFASFSDQPQYNELYIDSHLLYSVIPSAGGDYWKILGYLHQVDCKIRLMSYEINRYNNFISSSQMDSIKQTRDQTLEFSSKYLISMANQSSPGQNPYQIHIGRPTAVNRTEPIEIYTYLFLQSQEPSFIGTNWDLFDSTPSLCRYIYQDASSSGEKIEPPITGTSAYFSWASYWSSSNPRRGYVYASPRVEIEEKKSTYIYTTTFLHKRIEETYNDGQGHVFNYHLYSGLSNDQRAMADAKFILGIREGYCFIAFLDE